MGHSLGLRGQTGRLKVGYQVAAELGPFHLSPVGSGEWQIDAAVVSMDEFWVTQEAEHTLELTVGQQRWIWRSVRLVVGGGRVTGALTGRPERR